MDGQGRVLLPPLLREYAMIERTTKLVGQGKKFEIWSDRHWQDQCGQWVAANGEEETHLPQILENLSV